MRLSCGKDGLHVDLLRVGRFSAGFAWIGSGQAVSFKVPYQAVRGLAREGPVLHLAIDPAVATPFNRFALVRFSSDPHQALVKSLRARWWVVAVARIAPLVSAGAALLFFPTALAGGAVGRSALAFVAAFVAHIAGQQLVRWLNWGGPLSDRLAARFEREVSSHMGLEPTDAGAMLPSMLDASPTDRPARGLAGLVVRPRAFAFAALVGIAGSVAAVVAVQRYGIAGRVDLPVDVAVRGIAGEANQLEQRLHHFAEPSREACQCGHVDSQLWRAGIPEVSVLIAPRVGGIDIIWPRVGDTYPIRPQPGEPAPSDPDQRAPDEGGADDSDDEPPADRVDFDLAVVNNSATVLNTIDLVVTFARRDAQQRRRSIRERGLHWPAKLSPGQAVKWRVRAAGSEFRIDMRHQGKLQPGGCATGDDFTGLQQASLDVVRLHGAMMLAYLRDPRVKPTLEKLGALAPREQRARTLLTAALSPLAICDLSDSAQVLDICVHNGTAEVLRKITIEEVVAPIDGSEPQSWHIDDLFLPGKGLRVRIDVERSPGALQVVH